MNFDESDASLQLKKLIKEKKDYLEKITNDYARRKQQEEIMFLERDLLPIVLSSTSLLYWEVLKHVATRLGESLEMKADALLMVIPLTTRPKEEYTIAVDNIKACPFLNVDVDRLEVWVDLISVEGHTFKEPIHLPL